MGALRAVGGLRAGGALGAVGGLGAGGALEAAIGLGAVGVPSVVLCRPGTGRGLRTGLGTS